MMTDIEKRLILDVNAKLEAIVRQREHFALAQMACHGGREDSLRHDIAVLRFLTEGKPLGNPSGLVPALRVLAGGLALPRITEGNQDFYQRHRADIEDKIAITKQPGYVGFVLDESASPMLYAYLHAVFNNVMANRAYQSWRDAAYAAGRVLNEELHALVKAGFLKRWLFTGDGRLPLWHLDVPLPAQDEDGNTTNS
jgi:hypothetical protein